MTEVWWFKDFNVIHITQNHLAHASSKSNIYKHPTWKFLQKSVEITDIRLQFGSLEWRKKRTPITNKQTIFNPLKPNDLKKRRTAQLTSRCCSLYIYSTNTRTEYFKHAAKSPFFPLQNAVYFIILPFLLPVLFTF